MHASNIKKAARPMHNSNCIMQVLTVVLPAPNVFGMSLESVKTEGNAQPSHRHIINTHERRASPYLSVCCLANEKLCELGRDHAQREAGGPERLALDKYASVKHKFSR